MGGPTGEQHAAGEPTGEQHAARRLILLRHAKSGYPDGVADHDRPLAARGRREAALAGAWLAASQPQVETVLCSDALRARETLACAGIAAPVRHDRRLYGAGVGEILDLLATVPARARTVLIVAHAPGIPQTAAALAGPGSDPVALAALRSGFPTSAVAVLSVPAPWDAVPPGSCRLLTLHVPRA